MEPHCHIKTVTFKPAHEHKSTGRFWAVPASRANGEFTYYRRIGLNTWVRIPIIEYVRAIR